MATLMTAMVVGPAGVAAAKGPASLTITVPGIDEPIELIRDDDSGWAGADVMMLTGLWLRLGSAVSVSIPESDLGPAHVLTWVNSGPPDLTVEERTILQYVYLDAVGGALIHTPTQASLSGWGDDVTGWFVAPDGLVEALDRLTAEEGGTADRRSATGLAPYAALGVAALIGVIVATNRSRSRRSYLTGDGHPVAPEDLAGAADTGSTRRVD